jgi:dUTP pyrophosphatase
MINLGTEPIAVRRGDRIAQLVVAPVARARWREVAALTPTVRGRGGFGHTDR